MLLEGAAAQGELSRLLTAARAQAGEAHTTACVQRQSLYVRCVWREWLSDRSRE